MKTKVNVANTKTTINALVPREIKLSNKYFSRFKAYSPTLKFKPIYFIIIHDS